ncbi:hypothetical protein VB264_19965 [Arcicella aquatica]|uniref:Uncharacterized protein n=1 Tax=Arcicella aquatica TaxID=217141 RepID=A0ABU5QTD9_9BACT|nr:hypothetical protein [Arcicella aquatica]MEA5260084.1 hypothetical protein [Arcicella aquatica]
MKKILFIILAIGAALGAIILLFSLRKHPKKRSSSASDTFLSSTEEGLEKDRQMLLGDWQNIVGDFNTSFKKIA